MNRWWVVAVPTLTLASLVVVLAVSAAFGSSAPSPRNVPGPSPDTQQAAAVVYTGPASEEDPSQGPSGGLQMLATQTSVDGSGWTTRTLTSILAGC